MNIRVERRGLQIDGRLFPCTVRQRMGGGNLRVDKQPERGADDATSRMVWEWDGWEPRTLSLTIMVSTDSPGGGEDIRADLSALLHRAARGMEPELHQLGGTMLRAAGASDSPWVIMSDPDWDDDGVTNELTLTVELAEFDPEIASLRQAPAPQPEAPETEPDPNDPLTDADRERVRSLERNLVERQPAGPAGPQPQNP